MHKIKSDFCEIDKVDLQNIDKILAQKYGDVVRWAIVCVYDEKLKITFSYK